MATVGNPRTWQTTLIAITVCSLSFPAYAKYSGGTGEPNDPYQIATAEDLMLLGESPEDYDKHFILTADIDLDPNLPGGQVFGQEVIPDFSGTFDGNDHTILHLTIRGGSYLGLFGRLAGHVRDLGVVDASVIASAGFVGSLAGDNKGCVTRCYSTGMVAATGDCVGGLVGRSDDGEVTHCHSTVEVTGSGSVGGLVGSGGSVAYCYSHSSVSGYSKVGGLVGTCSDSVAHCYSAGSAYGKYTVGGLVGSNQGTVARCYSTSTVTGADGKAEGSSFVGGLAGDNFGSVVHCYSAGAVSGGVHFMGGLVGGIVDLGSVTGSFWDTQTSGQSTGDGGTGLTTAQMQDIQTYLEARWDFAGESKDGLHEVWRMPSEGGYPILAIFNGYAPPQLQGKGTPFEPYLISDARDLGAMYYYSPDAHYRLAAPIDLSGIRWSMAVIPRFAGTFYGNRLTISNLTIDGLRSSELPTSNFLIDGVSRLGLFGRLESGSVVKDLGVADVNVTGFSSYVGGVAGYNGGGHVVCCHSTGMVGGYSRVGGLVGGNNGDVTYSRSAGLVNGWEDAGGLVGINDGSVAACYSTAAVGTTGGWYEHLGGLVGTNAGSVSQCYSSGAVTGVKDVGGLIGQRHGEGRATDSFWDTQTSGQSTRAGGTGKTTAEMQTASTFLEAGWDFVGETANGTEDIWWINEGKDYPRLWWEGTQIYD